VYGIIEGLAGVKDAGVGMDKLCLIPRWSASPSQNATVCARYAAADGYVAYRYAQTADTITLTLTAKADQRELRVLMPAATSATGLVVNGQPGEFSNEHIEESTYCCTQLSGPGVHEVVIPLD
jgi:hypothetical protein